MVSARKQMPCASQQEYTLEEEALIRQWLEYKKTVLDRLTSQPLPISVCLELNEELSSKTFLTGTKYSKADLEVLLGLQTFYVTQTQQFKEKYCHLSRWYSQVQYLNKDQLQTLVSFCRSSLY